MVASGHNDILGYGDLFTGRGELIEEMWGPWAEIFRGRERVGQVAAKGRACSLFVERGGSVWFFIKLFYLDNEVKGFFCWGTETLEEGFWKCNESVSCIQSGSESSLVEEGWSNQFFERPYGGSGCRTTKISRVSSAGNGSRVSGLRSYNGAGVKILSWNFCHSRSTGSFLSYS